MKQFFLVFIGGGFGTLLRFIISKSFNDFFHNFFLGTFLVNIIGCFLIGFILGTSMKGNLLSKDQILLLSTGFCGGFTTFSAFALENHGLLQSGQLLHFSFYTISSIAVGVLAVAAGLWLARLI